MLILFTILVTHFLMMQKLDNKKKIHCHKNMYWCEMLIAIKVGFQGALSSVITRHNATLEIPNFI